jgi:hypothetical protein
MNLKPMEGGDQVNGAGDEPSRLDTLKSVLRRSPRVRDEPSAMRGFRPPSTGEADLPDGAQGER